MDLVTLAVLLFLVYFFKFIMEIIQNSDPPGPTVFPLIGNIPQIVKTHKITYLSMHKLSRVYGNVMTLSIGAKKMIVISGKDELKELMHNPIFDDRPQTNGEGNLFNEILYGDRHFNAAVLFANGNVWRMNRRFALRTLKDCGMGTKTTETLAMEEASYMIEYLESQFGPGEEKQVIKNPELLFTKMALNMIWQLATGERFDYNHQQMETFLKNLQSFNELGITTMSGPMALMESLRYFPPFRGQVRQRMRDIKNIRDHFHGVVREHEETLDPSNPRNYIDAFLSEKPKDPDIFSNDQLVAFLMDLFLAGSETASKSLAWACLFMMSYSEVQQKVFEEIEEVVGSSAMVSDHHRGSLPYTEATLLEIWRLGPVGPIAALRYCSKDTIIGGHLIKKGSHIIPLIYSLTVDGKVFPDPYRFLPTRHLGPNGKVKFEEEFFTFGMGRRRCLGESVAKN